MARQFTFADPGEGIHEAEVVEVNVSPGDHVEEGDPVLVVETDKAETELPSPYTGQVQDIPVSEGDTVEVDDVLVVFADDDDEAPADGDEATERDTTDGDGEPGEMAEAGAARTTAEAEDAPTEPEGTDEDDEDAEDDDEGGKAAAVGELPTEEPHAEHPSDERPEPGSERAGSAGGPVPASPATRRLARERGIDLTRIEGSGPHGRVTSQDVEDAAEQEPDTRDDEGARPQRDEGARPQRDERAPERPELPDFEQWGPIERVRLRSIRRTTARRVAVSWREIPQVTHHDVVDVTALERWRREHSAQVEDAGGELSLMVLVTKALAGVLSRHPRFNASLDLDAEEIVLKHHYHIGLAVDTDDGLIVPVIRDVDRKPLIGLATEISGLIGRVRAREVQGEELTGGTFTVTNVGPLGGDGFTPLIRHPEVAILGMGQARLEQVVTGDLDAHRTVVQLRLPLSLTYDHRVVDGADAARFIGDLGSAIADPGALLLNT